MTNRERISNILHDREPDRMPAVHFGYWPELLTEWAEKGQIPRELAVNNFDGSEREAELDRLIGWDCNYYRVVGPNNGLSPPFASKVLEVLPDGSQRTLSPCGVIERVKPGISSIPSEDDYLLKDREAFETLFKPKMRFFPERVPEAYFRTFNGARDQGSFLGLHLGSVMGQIRDMTSLVGMSYLMYDEDERLLPDIVDTYADMQYRCAEAVLQTGAVFDFAHFWEDICFKNGPLLSPAMFRKLCGRHLRQRSDLCRQHGIDLISVDCDGVIGKLIPIWIENGVNIMFPLEVGVWGDQFEPARREFGRELRGVGGMDKTAFRKDRAAVDRELERMRRLSALGGFIPCPDHRLMPGSRFDLVRYYAERIKRILE